MIKVKVDEICTVQQQPPPWVGYNLGNGLILEDAFGERKPLPLEFCWSQLVCPLYNSWSQT